MNYVIYCGYDVVDKFIDYMIKLEDEFLGVLCELKFMDLFEKEIKVFQEVIKCYICNKELGEDIVCDYCYVMGKF